MFKIRTHSKYCRLCKLIVIAFVAGISKGGEVGRVSLVRAEGNGEVIGVVF